MPRNEPKPDTNPGGGREMFGGEMRALVEFTGPVDGVVEKLERVFGRTFTIGGVSSFVEFVYDTEKNPASCGGVGRSAMAVVVDDCRTFQSTYDVPLVVRRGRWFFLVGDGTAVLNDFFVHSFFTDRFRAGPDGLTCTKGVFIQKTTTSAVSGEYGPLFSDPDCVSEDGAGAWSRRCRECQENVVGRNETGRFGCRRWAGGKNVVEVER